jgi:hypothetical protein
MQFLNMFGKEEDISLLNINDNINDKINLNKNHINNNINDNNGFCSKDIFINWKESSKYDGLENCKKYIFLNYYLLFYRVFTF